MSKTTTDNSQLRPHIIKPGDNDPGYFSMTRFCPVTDDFYFWNGFLVILHPFEVIWESPVLARSLKSLEEHIQYIQQNQIKKAIVIAEDISFIRRCPDLECLRIIPPYSADTFDYSPLYDMPNLKELNCQTIYGPKDNLNTDLDYSRIPNLRQLCVDGAKGHHNLSLVKGLRKLYLGQGQPVSKALAELDLSAVEELDICQSPLRSLNGLEGAKNLQKLTLSYCRSLEDASSLSAVGDTLVSLEVEACGKIKDFSWLEGLQNLENLVLYGSNTLSDLGFLQNMKKLKVFSFSMNVQDGNLSLCKQIPYVHCKNRKHYNLKDKELPKGGK